MPPKHSGLGIASFVISCLTAVGMLGMFAYAGIVATTKPEVLEVDTSPELITIAVSILALAAVDLVALGLGIAGITQRVRNRLFAILGTIISAGIVVLLVALFIMGLMEE